MYTKKYISEDSLTGLKNYKYQSGEYSIMDRVMTPFWEGCVKLLPLWLAPNMVTLIGFVFVIANVLMYVPYDWTLAEKFPPWYYALSGIVFFTY